MNKEIRRVFVDLDSTLIHAESLWGGGGVSKSRKIVDTGGNEKYGTILRGGALELLRQLRALFPVFMLTTSIQEYAQAHNKAFDLGFSNNQIYAREDIASGDLELKPPGKCFLIDDRHINEHKGMYGSGKFDFLEPTGPVTYIKVSPFHGHPNGNFSDQDIQSIVNQIKFA